MSLRASCRLARTAPVVVATLFFGLTNVASQVVWGQARQWARLVYSIGPGARGCPNEAVLRTEVSSRLRYDPFGPDGPVTVAASVVQQGESLRARVTLAYGAASEGPSREIVSRRTDCEELVRSVAVAVSIALDPLEFGHGTAYPGGQAERPPSASVPAETASPVADEPMIAPQSEAQSAVVPAEERAARTGQRTDESRVALRPAARVVPVPPRSAAAQPWRWAVGLRIVGSIGRVPGLALGALIFGEVRRGAFSVGIEAWSDWPGTAPFAVGQTSIWPVAASLVPCFSLYAVGLCAVATAGAVRAEGSGYATNRVVIAPLLAAGPRLIVSLPLAHLLSLQAHVDAFFPIVTTRFDVSGHAAWSSSYVSGSAGLGVKVNFP